ncbi:MAG: metallophosphoesterase [Chlamydiota bacterium]
MVTSYYFISDLHIGGDGPLDQCEFKKELILFLQQLENEAGDVELIIAGDAFGLWEYTQLKGIDKMRTLVKSHPDLFEQFKQTGKKIKITLIPGNHDYDLACYPEYIPFLKEYGIDLEQKEHIRRNLGEKWLWIEHGNQHDSFNAFEHFGDVAEAPIGYFVTAQFVSGAGEVSKRGKQDWVKDIQAVYPTEHIPYWVFSNYYYREMSPLLRYLLLPFLLLFSVSVIAAFLGLAEEAGILPPYLSIHHFLEKIGGLGMLLNIIIAINSSIITFLLALSIPLYFIYRDVMATLKRYQLVGNENLAVEKEEDYINAAKKVFEENDNVVAFLYGHTHNASLRHEDGKVIINTGTWLKKLTRHSSHFRLLPDVYVPSYSLSVFKIYENKGKIVIDYHEIPKEGKDELTILQKVMTFGKKSRKAAKIPEKTELFS